MLTFSQIEQIALTASIYRVILKNSSYVSGLTYVSLKPSVFVCVLQGDGPIKLNVL